jgi:hypothetical protein
MTYGALHASPAKFGSPCHLDLLGFLKLEVVYSSPPVRSAASAILAPAEGRPAVTYMSHDQSPSVQGLVAIGYFVSSFAVFALDLVVGHLLPYHLVVAVQGRIGLSICSD